MNYFLKPFDSKIAPIFQDALLLWFDHYGRHDLPWKPQPCFDETTNLYRIWISEIMLQQTQVITDIPFFLRFMERFPDLQTLAKAPIDDVLKYWEGLGYCSRARNLHHTAQTLIHTFHKKFPKTLEEMISLKGIGQSTAAAILSQGYNLPFAILDGNVKRVLSRTLGCTAPASLLDKALKPCADILMSQTRAADYTQAIMDFGATLCTKKPLCLTCFFKDKCVAFETGKVLELPTPKPKKTNPIVERYFLILKMHNEMYFVIKRPMKGIWSGLWSFIEKEEIDYLLWQKENHRYIDSLESYPTITHKFSHYTLIIKPVFITLSSNFPCNDLPQEGEFIKKETFSKLALPAPIKVFWNKHLAVS